MNAPQTIRRLLPPLLLFLLAFALFAPSVGYHLVNLDDTIFIYNNPIVFNGFSWTSLGRAFTALHGDRMMYNPLLWVSYLLDSLLYGASPYVPWGYHLSNVLLHAANAVLLWAILLAALPRRPWLAFFAAAFWAFHPLRVESVAWVTERKDTLSTFFAFLAILLYLQAFFPTRHSSLVTRHCGKGKQCLALLAFAAGLLSKPMLVTLPFLFLLLDFWPLGRFSLRDAPRALPRLALEKWPFFLLALLFSLLTYRLQTGAISDLPLSERLLRVPVNVLFYLSRTLWPVNLCPLASGFPATLPWLAAAAAVFLLLAAAALRLARRAPGVLVGLLAFAGLLAPVSGLVPIGGVPVADRYAYLPSLGLSLALLALLDTACPAPAPPRNPKPETRSPFFTFHFSLFTFLAAALLAAFAAVTLRILPSWKDSESFAARAAKIAPGHVLSQMYRFIDAFYFKGDLPAAADAAERCWTSQLSSPFATLAKIFVASQTDSSSAAIAFYEQHPIDAPANDPSHNALPVVMAVLYADVGDFAKAAECIRQALANPNCLPKTAESVAAVAFWLYASQGADAQAAAVARRVPSIDPANLRDPANFLLPYAAMWNLGLRRQTLPRLLALAGDAPDNPALLNNVAWLLATAPNSPAPPADVLAIAQRARDLSPDHPIVRDTLAVALAFAGQFDDAIALDSDVAAALRSSSFPGASALLAQIEKRLELFRARVPFTENADIKLLYAP